MDCVKISITSPFELQLELIKRPLLCSQFDLNFGSILQSPIPFDLLAQAWSTRGRGDIPDIFDGNQIPQSFPVNMLMQPWYLTILALWMQIPFDTLTIWHLPWPALVKTPSSFWCLSWGLRGARPSKNVWFVWYLTVDPPPLSPRFDKGFVC